MALLSIYKNVRKELTKSPVYYLVDLGLRNYASGEFTRLTDSSLGFLFQNFVFNALREKLFLPAHHLHFWRTKEKAEVDFVLEKRFGEPVAIEVKATNMKSPEVSRSFRSFLSTYKSKHAFVVNLGFQGSRTIDSTKVKFILPYEIASVYEFLG